MKDCIMNVGGKCNSDYAQGIICDGDIIPDNCPYKEVSEMAGMGKLMGALLSIKCSTPEDASIITQAINKMYELDEARKLVIERERRFECLTCGRDLRSKIKRHEIHMHFCDFCREVYMRKVERKQKEMMQREFSKRRGGDYGRKHENPKHKRAYKYT